MAADQNAAPSTLPLKRRRVIIASTVLVIAALCAWYCNSDFIEPHPGHYDVDAKSIDLEQDLMRMWETQPLSGTPDSTHGPNPKSSTDRAINAASRVFNTVNLGEKSRDEVIGILGNPKLSSDSIYNFPFWSAPKGSLVYRFDNGAYGWQFNVQFGEDGKVHKVDRHWIH